MNAFLFVYDFAPLKVSSLNYEKYKNLLGYRKPVISAHISHDTPDRCGPNIQKR